MRTGREPAAVFTGRGATGMIADGGPCERNAVTGVTL